MPSIRSLGRGFGTGGTKGLVGAPVSGVKGPAGFTIFTGTPSLMMVVGNRVPPIGAERYVAVGLALVPISVDVLFAIPPSTLGFGTVILVLQLLLNLSLSLLCCYVDSLKCRLKSRACYSLGGGTST